MNDEEKIEFYNKCELLTIDITPDENLPIRILEAYLKNCNNFISTTSNLEDPLNEPNPVYKYMNECQVERKAILEKAIKILLKKNSSKNLPCRCTEYITCAYCAGYIGENEMFHKTADMPIEKIFCSCGQELATTDKKCPNCEKEIIKEEPEKKS